MLNEQQIESIRPQTFIVQMICAALILGVLAFAAIICVIAPWDEVHRNLSIFAMLGAGSAVITFPLAILLPKLITDQAAASAMSELKSSGEKMDLTSETGLKKLASNYLTATIIRYALLEGPLFVNLLFFFLDHSIICAIVGALGLMLMLLFFPFPNRQIGWIEDRLREV